MLAASSLISLIGVVGVLLPSSASAAPAASEPEVREAMLVTYIHGVDDRLAEEVLAPGARPALRRLLEDPAFPRRDNIVAFLAHFGDEEGVPALLEFLANPPAAVEVPEEDRALLMAPEALGHLARRGHRAGLDVLLRWTAADGDAAPLLEAAGRAKAPASVLDDLLEMSLRGLAFTGAPEARQRLLEVQAGGVLRGGGTRDLTGAAGRSLGLFDALRPAAVPGTVSSTASPAVSPDPASPAGGRIDRQAGTAGGGSSGSPHSAGVDGCQGQPDPVENGAESLMSFDTQLRVHAVRLTYSNHVALTNPIDLERLDTVLDLASLRAGREDYPSDVACCITVAIPLSPGENFGSTNDGLDVIDSANDLNAVLGNPVSRVKVVRAIQYCGGPGSNIIGCAGVGANGIAVVRRSEVGSEGVLWIHEYGHNVGLGHSPDPGAIMFASDNGSNSGLSQGECNQYHFPAPGAEITPQDVGPCRDLDGDDVQDGFDNCPNLSNFDQVDGDDDGVGDACDNCPSTPGVDTDGDGACDLTDNCPALPNPSQVDADGDHIGDPCDSCPFDRFNDQDLDGLCGDLDNCPQVSNSGQQDADSDGIGDDCDLCPQDASNDPDEDLVCNAIDNCPGMANPSQSDWDGDGLGNECDIDREGDGIENGADNCADDVNPGQQDRDVDGLGDACDGIRTVDDNGPAQFRVIQSAIVAASPGEVVRVLPGFYQENLLMKGGVDVVGPGPALATIDGSAASNQSTVNISNLDAPVRVSGFTIRGGNVTSFRRGGGIHIQHSQVEVTGNLITGNTSRHGGGIFLEGDPALPGSTITNNVIVGNLAQNRGGGVAVWYGTPTTRVRHNTIADNTSILYAAGLWITASDSFEISNNVISTNSSPNSGNGVFVQGSTPPAAFSENDVFGNAVADYLNMADPTGTNGNVSAAPSFVSPATRDYSPAPGSALIDAGSTMGDPFLDELGTPRPLEGNAAPPSRSDIGALEYVPPDADGDGVANASDTCPFAHNPSQPDADGDGVGDACDSCPSASDAAQSDLDRDGVGDVCDNCPVVPNADQTEGGMPGVGLLCSDSDADGVLDPDDCAPLNGGSYAAPGEPGSLVVESDRTTLSWSSAAPGAGTGTVHDVLRGALGQLPVGTGVSETCVGSGTPASFLADPEAPASGQGFWYLVRGRNACGASIYGSRSDATPSTSGACP